MKRVLLLPCDTRPPTLEYVAQLGRIAGVEVIAPPLTILNDLNIPGDTVSIAAWLLEQAPQVDAAIIALETLCLGGMIPARRVTDSLEVALQRLELLRILKAANPRLRILAYGVIVRVAHGDDPFEEKAYYGQWGAALRLVSEWTDRCERGGDAAMLESARAGVPPEVLEDWLGTRERNHALHGRALELVGDGVIEHLCLTLDDTTPYGLAARDRRRLEARTDELGCWDKVDIYPGADEVACTLLARAVTRTSGRPPRVFVRYPSHASPLSTLLFEDRTLAELVKAHVRSAGCVPASTPEGADLILAVNAPTTRQAHTQPDFETVDTANRHLPEFIDRIAADLELGRRVTIADVAYPNGAEVRFTKLLLSRVDVTRLSGYGAWNTAGNTLGAAIASGVLAIETHDHLALCEANLSRLVDDWLYQSVVREEVAALLGHPDEFDLGDLTASAELEIERRMKPLALELFERHFAPHLPGVTLEWRGAGLAWPRLFTGVFALTLNTFARRPPQTV